MADPGEALRLVAQFVPAPMSGGCKGCGCGLLTIALAPVETMPVGDLVPAPVEALAWQRARRV